MTPTGTLTGADSSCNFSGLRPKQSLGQLSYLCQIMEYYLAVQCVAIRNTDSFQTDQLVLLWHIHFIKVINLKWNY